LLSNQSFSDIMIELSILSFLLSLIKGSSNVISTFVKSYGYIAIFALMALESSSLPVPSEVVLPLAGLFAAQHILNFPLALIAAILGSVLGTVVDYAIGYFIGKDVVYKHLRFFHIKKESLDSFDRWFEKNGVAAVFFTRFVPVVRTFINFPAGFAKMPFKKFMAYSTVGIVIWDVVLMVFGFYVLSVNSAVVALAGIGVFAIVLYIIYKYAMKRMRK
jgi:membrane protein DedA with SNARE-associated domain